MGPTRNRRGNSYNQEAEATRSAKPKAKKRSTHTHTHTHTQSHTHTHIPPAQAENYTIRTKYKSRCAITTPTHNSSSNTSRT